jgi:hypothetical protein
MRTDRIEFYGYQWYLEKHELYPLVTLRMVLDDGDITVLAFDVQGKYIRAPWCPDDVGLECNDRGQIRQDRGELDPCFYEGCETIETDEHINFIDLSWYLIKYMGDRGQEQLGITVRDKEGDKWSVLCVNTDGTYMREVGVPPRTGICVNSRGQIKQAK